MHIGESPSAAPAPLDTLKSGFSQFGAASATNRGTKLSLPQSAFAVKKWDSTSSLRAVAASASAGSATNDQPATAPRLTGDRVAWQGAFRAAPVSKVVDSNVVQTAGQLPLDPVKAAMSPVPSSPDLHAEPVAKPPVGPENIKVPVTPPADHTIVLDNPDAERRSDADNCRSARGLKSIRSITADINVKRDDLEGGKQVPPDCAMGEERLEPRHWQRTTFSWVAADTYHKPIYFDDDQLERYGHTFGPVTQTTLSAVKFFATVPLVPYYMGVYPPNECIYDLGTYRPGSCAPYYFDPFPLSVRGAINEMYLGIIPAL
jgi:hypothetical protein